MGDLVRTLVLCGLLSGTQPITMMGLLLVLGGATPRANGLAFVSGAFAVQAGLLVGASALFGGTVSQGSDTGRTFIGIRIALGLVLFSLGMFLRRPPRKPIPEIPHALASLQAMGPGRSFIAGIVVADYQGPVIASFALASSSVAFTGRLAGLGVYALIASGLPLGLMLWTTVSQRARERVTRLTTRVLHHRRSIASWFGIVGGALLVADGFYLLSVT